MTQLEKVARAKFEKWYASRFDEFDDAWHFEKSNDKQQSYVADDTDRSWEAWQAALSAMDGWQSMDSAPKDGTHILVWRNTKINECWWRHDIDRIDGAWGGIGWYFPNDRLPTYWQPLPEPPRGES